MKQGYFITFEGPDGSGKTTISTLVFNKLKEHGYRAIYTREPGGSSIAEQIRQIILDPQNIEMDKKTEALLYAASRRQHLVEKILPHLQDGDIVISDRFVDSSLAYQGVGREIGLQEVWDINMFAIEGRVPDLTIFLDIDPELGLARINNRSFKDRLDQESLEFHKKVFSGYQQIKEKYQDRMAIFDATQTIEELTSEVYDTIINWIATKESHDMD